MSLKFRNLAVVLICSVYVALRFWHFTDSCLWFDEIFSIHAAEHSWDSLISFVALDLIHPPLFYVLLKLWIGGGGESLAWLRMFPVIFSVVSLVPLILFLREMKQNTPVQLICLFLLTVNGSLLKYSIEVRMYSLLMCIALFSMWLFARYFVKGKSFIPLVIVNVLLVYTHYFGWFVVLSEVAAILIYQRIKWRRILMMFAITFASFVPWIIAVFQAAHSGSELGQNIGWMSRPSPSAITQFILNLIEPFYYQASTADPVSIFKISLPILLITVIAIGLYFADWKQQSDDEQQTVKLLILFAALPLISAFVLSWLLPYSIWGTRHLIVVFAPFAILTAIAVTKIQIFWLRTAVLTLIILFCGYAFILESSRTRPQYSWCVLEDLIGIEESKQEGRVYTFEDLLAYHLWFMYRREPSFPLTVVKVENVSGITEDSAYFLPRGFTDVTLRDLNEVNDKRFWLVFRGSTTSESEPPLRDFINKGYKVLEQKEISVSSETVFLVLVEK